jgi:hypothetical protein
MRIVYLLEGCFCIKHILKYEHLTIFWIMACVQFAFADADVDVLGSAWRVKVIYGGEEAFQ